MTYTRHRDTRETLQILDRLDLDSDKPTEEEIMVKFGLDEQFRTSQLTCWQRVRPKIWLLFEEPNSTLAAKVRSLCLKLMAHGPDIDAASRCQKNLCRSMTPIFRTSFIRRKKVIPKNTKCVSRFSTPICGLCVIRSALVLQ